MNTSDTNTPSDSGALAPATRRSMLKAAAWTTPAIVMASAAPAFAASSDPRVNLYSLAANANEAPDGTTAAGGYPYYEGVRTLTYTVTYGNLGPDAMPAGAIISLGLAHPAIWNDASIRVTSDPRSKNPVFTQRRTEFVTPASETTPAHNRVWYDFTLGQPIPAGQSFTITYSIQLTATWNTSSAYWSVRDFADIGVGGTQAVDTQLANNRSRDDDLRMYNPNN